jgi:hypothetical protein
MPTDDMVMDYDGRLLVRGKYYQYRQKAMRTWVDEGPPVEPKVNGPFIIYDELLTAAQEAALIGKCEELDGTLWTTV